MIEHQLLLSAERTTYFIQLHGIYIRMRPPSRFTDAHLLIQVPNRHQAHSAKQPNQPPYHDVG
jgi:hypothetical protein